MNDSQSVNQNKKPRSIRNRLINLRHRRNQNLTQDSDYIGVLDSLKVERKENASVEDTSDGGDNHDSRPDTSSLALGSILTTNIEILDAGKATISNESTTTKQLEDMVRDDVPLTSNSIVKSLNSQKRKIELEENESYESKVKRKSSASANDLGEEEKDTFEFNKRKTGRHFSRSSKKEDKRNYRNLTKCDETESSGEDN